MSQSRTEDPTPRRLKEARRAGHVARSADVQSAGVLLAAVLVMPWVVPAVLASWRSGFDRAMGAMGVPLAEPALLLVDVVGPVASDLLPLMVVVVAGALTVGLLQVGPLVALGRSSARGFRRGPVRWSPPWRAGDRWAEVAVLALKVLALAAVACWTLVESLPGLTTLSTGTTAGVLDAAAELGRTIFYRVTGAICVIAVGDLFYRRWSHKRSLRMTRAELLRERREAEGDPRHRRERRRHYDESGPSPWGDADPDLVVRGAHGLAVALRYQPALGDRAPIVVEVARGGATRALLERAVRVGATLAEDPSLAQVLARLSAGEPISRRSYESVARYLTVRDGRP